MVWEKRGTIALENGSKTVSATGVSWASPNVMPGYILYIEGQKLYEIGELNGAGELTLEEGYAGPTAQSVSYVIVPTKGADDGLHRLINEFLERDRALAAEHSSLMTNLENAYNSWLADRQVEFSQVAAHKGRTDNPHAVTAAQVGAPTVAQMNAAVAPHVDHAGKTDNPHSVTAAQVGALPASGGTVSGKLRVGTTQDRPAEFSRPAGFSVSGAATGQVQASTDDALAALLNRDGSHGDIQAWHHDGVEVGALDTNGRMALSGGLLLGGADQANLLDDYEEGTFAPYLTFDGSNHGMSYLVRAGRYRKIGSLVYARYGVRLSAKGTSTGVARIQGFPFVTESVSYADCVSAAIISGGSNLPSSPQLMLANGVNWGRLIGYVSGGFSTLNQSHLNGGSYIMGTAVYNTV